MKLCANPVYISHVELSQRKTNRENFLS